MKLTKQRLAESTQRELEEAIRRNPLAWLPEIMDSIEYPATMLRGLIVALYSANRVWPDDRTRELTIPDMVDAFAVAAGQQAYDTIISHPGNIE